MKRAAFAVLALAAGVAKALAAPAGNVAAGKVVYERCLACHALEYDRTGPRHCGLFGRRAGSVPGTSMGYAGVKDRTERAGLVAYLKQACPKV